MKRHTRHAFVFFRRWSDGAGIGSGGRLHGRTPETTCSLAAEPSTSLERVWYVINILAFARGNVGILTTYCGFQNRVSCSKWEKSSCLVWPSGLQTQGLSVDLSGNLPSSEPIDSVTHSLLGATSAPNEVSRLIGNQPSSQAYCRVLSTTPTSKLGRYFV